MIPYHPSLCEGQSSSLFSAESSRVVSTFQFLTRSASFRQFFPLDKYERLACPTTTRCVAVRTIINESSPSSPDSWEMNVALKTDHTVFSFQRWMDFFLPDGSERAGRFQLLGVFEIKTNGNYYQPQSYRSCIPDPPSPLTCRFVASPLSTPNNLLVCSPELSLLVIAFWY